MFMPLLRNDDDNFGGQVVAPKVRSIGISRTKKIDLFIMIDKRTMRTVKSATVYAFQCLLKP